MFFPKPQTARRFLALALFLYILPASAAAANGIVTVALEWGTSAQSYTYIFSGLVLCQNHPCVNVRVDLALDTDTRGTLTQTTTSGDDGRYQMEITLPGSAQDTSLWKLEARSGSSINRETAEAEGRVVNTESQTTVVVDRSLLLIQA